MTPVSNHLLISQKAFINSCSILVLPHSLFIFQTCFENVLKLFKTKCILIIYYLVWIMSGSTKHIYTFQDEILVLFINITRFSNNYISVLYLINVPCTYY